FSQHRFVVTMVEATDKEYAATAASAFGLQLEEDGTAPPNSVFLYSLIKCNDKSKLLGRLRTGIHSETGKWITVADGVVDRRSDEQIDVHTAVNDKRRRDR